MSASIKSRVQVANTMTSDPVGTSAHMNQVYPVLPALLTTVQPGSIVITNRGRGRVALITNHATIGTPSTVFLNANYDKSPSVLFAENWKIDDHCLLYNEHLHFELGVGSDECDASGHDWWDTCGVIVAIEGEFFIRAGLYN